MEYNGKAVYVGGEYFPWDKEFALVKGKEYEFVDGKFTDDNGKMVLCTFRRDELVPNGFVPLSEGGER